MSRCPGVEGAGEGGAAGVILALLFWLCCFDTLRCFLFFFFIFLFISIIIIFNIIIIISLFVLMFNFFSSSLVDVFFDIVFRPLFSSLSCAEIGADEHARG